METRLGELGYRFFTSKERLVWYIETLLDIDIDGDDVIGEVEGADTAPDTAAGGPPAD